MGNLIDEVHYYQRVVNVLFHSDDPEVSGALEYFLRRLLQARQQLKEVMS